ncbi:MAG: T9SS type A sorting domain-containing protein [Dysgonamonadaceae bacterium]|jgi:hypothetical protein|nr:T9SS type A sorting domain-containing protein [Dysgonamonadaceae bacterium]
MKTYKAILFMVFMNICPLLYSQSRVSFGYDAAGNRISRTIVITQQNQVSAPPQEETDIYSEMLTHIEIRIYPNPTEGLLKVEINNLPENETAIIALYNLSGQAIVVRRGVSGYSEIDISSQPQGAYVMKIAAGEEHTEWKIIKR